MRTADTFNPQGQKYDNACVNILKLNETYLLLTGLIYILGLLS